MNIVDYFVTFFGLCFFYFGLTAMIWSRRMNKYLKENHFEKWKYINHIGSIGPLTVNSFTWIPFIFSEDDLDDRIVEDIKKQIRKNFIFSTISFFLMPILSLMFM